MGPLATESPCILGGGGGGGGGSNNNSSSSSSIGSSISSSSSSSSSDSSGGGGDGSSHCFHYGEKCQRVNFCAFVRTVNKGAATGGNPVEDSGSESY